MLNLPTNKIWVILGIIAFGYSCNHGGKLNQQDMMLVKKDSVEYKSSSVEFPNDFVALKRYFLKDSVGKIDSTAKISLPLIKIYLKDSLDTSFNRSVNPIRLIENKSGYFFIIRQNCIAGGDCAIFRLLVFDLNGQFVKNKELGMLSADESERTTFRYKLINDSLLMTYEITYDEEKDEVVDSTAKTVKLDNISD